MGVNYNMNSIFTSKNLLHSFRFISILNRLEKMTEIFIPTLAILLDYLNLIKISSKHTQKKLIFNSILISKVTNTIVNDRILIKVVISKIMDGILEHLVNYAYHPALP